MSRSISAELLERAVAAINGLASIAEARGVESRVTDVYREVAVGIQECLRTVEIDDGVPPVMEGQTSLYDMEAIWPESAKRHSPDSSPSQGATLGP